MSASAIRLPRFVHAPRSVTLWCRYMENRPEFNRTARAWTQRHAVEGGAAAAADDDCVVVSSSRPALPFGAQPGDSPAVLQLLEMGFERGRVMQALASNGNNVERATMALLG